MSTRDMVGLVVSYLYAGGLLVAAELVQRRAGIPATYTRKLVHIGAGMWIFGILALFETWYIGLIPFATFIGLNYLFYRYRVFRAIDASDSSPGTVYFALSITVLFALLWRTGGQPDYAPLAAAAVMAMTWGDALAALCGQAFGRRRYRVAGSTRTLEGSAVMLLTSMASMGLTLWLLPGSPLSPNGIALGPGGSLLTAAAGALVATLAEAVSPHGTDNLSVPLLTGLALWLTVQVL